MQKSLMLMPYEQMVGAFGRRVFKEMRASFFCSRNPDVQNFIHPECSKYEKDFNLSLHSIILGDLTSGLDEKTMSVLRGYGKRDARSVGCYLIGQLARDDSYSHSDISGNEILREVLTRLSYARNIVGGRFVAKNYIGAYFAESYYVVISGQKRRNFHFFALFAFFAA